MQLRYHRPLLAAAAVTVIAVTGCAPTADTAGQLVLADSQPLADYNPILGYGALGVSPIYEGLLAPAADTDTTLPRLAPALAAAEPVRLSGNTWRVPLREDVTFSDGTALDSADVVATYRAVADPAVASDIAAQFTPLTAVTADGPHAVTVTMDSPASPNPYLLLGIVPSEKVEAGPAATWKLNTTPTGTGPYTLQSLRADQAVMVARPDYRGGPPAIDRVVYVHTPDDNSRAQRMRAGEIDGANLPPRLAQSLSGQPGMTVQTVASADWRAISLPAGNEFTADQAARTAMNVAVDRASMVDDVLVGSAAPASTPVSAVYGDYYNPDAQFDHDVARAEQLLDQAGWRRNGDGVRVRGTTPAAFVVRYESSDTVRRDLAVAFAEQMRQIGVQVRTVGSSWDDIEAHLDRDGVVLAGGEMPYSIDQQVVTTLHTRTAGSGPFANRGNFTAPGLDALLDQARATPDGPNKADLYRQIQHVYTANPSSVFLTFMHHTYGVKDTAMTQPAAIMEPHAHGVTWGPWWNLPAWKRPS
ncbi:ABC transporter substrate-binding protein [Gordonia phosphorivorans]|uniref:ABC transporter substrate-binding protein n=1 Tax=Gordonia phosphorivorans TaxID=1056982 RepID=A0ABV6H7K8_9ACTN